MGSLVVPSTLASHHIPLCASAIPDTDNLMNTYYYLHPGFLSVPEVSLTYQ